MRSRAEIAADITKLIMAIAAGAKPRCFRQGGRCNDRFLAEPIARTTKSPLTQRAFVKLCHLRKSGAGEGIRTLDPDLGKFRYSDHVY